MRRGLSKFPSKRSKSPYREANRRVFKKQGFGYLKGKGKSSRYYRGYYRDV